MTDQQPNNQPATTNQNASNGVRVARQIKLIKAWARTVVAVATLVWVMAMVSLDIVIPERAWYLVLAAAGFVYGLDGALSVLEQFKRKE